MTFPATYCITCAQTERPAKARANFAAAGVPARFVQGVYGRQWGLETRLCAHDDWRIDTGHVGLNLSHWMVWQLALDRGAPEVLICEDDAIFCPGFLQLFAQHRSELPDDWQIWFVGSVGSGEHMRPATASLRHLDHRGPHGTHCYLARRSALPVLIERCQEARVYIDQTIDALAMPYLIGYASCPSLVGQHSAEGTWPHAVGGVPESPAPASIEDELRTLDHVPGWCCPEKRRVIYDAVKSLASPSPVCVELGVFGGQSLIPAAMALRDRGNGRIVGIDPYTAVANLEGQQPGDHADWWRAVDYQAAENACRNAIRDRDLFRWCELRKAMPEDVAGDFASLDYLHLDDSHATEVAIRNTRAWLPKLAPGGILILDDCEWESVKPARAMIAAELALIGADPSEGRRWEVYRRP